MPYFHDSNVIIGYYFQVADTWGQEATTVFEDPEPNHTSTFVWAECFGLESGGRCTTIQSAIRREFRRVIAALTREESIETLLTMVQDWRICSIVRTAASGVQHDPRRLITILRDVHERYQQECAGRLMRLENPDVLSVHTRNTPYNDLYRCLEEYINDPDDIEVILDAHDVAQAIAGLILWTGDLGHIVAHRQKIVEKTAIAAVCFLGWKTPV
ncbi:hypothetical protein AZH53_09840 [Methanomicrobiaceae archaeon CYW5]|uniref:hypothetical protein n=1 Tax=Methanovulcanius yangii TaxID=1789227 RepID=UPI0029C9F541|nr:hypothetical protein [Methanovulcanius yangii]MBT8508705.1 hypothetical protein [Methanovulcanius yangii]